LDLRASTIDLTSGTTVTDSPSQPLAAPDWVKAPDATRARLSADLEAEYWRVASTNLWTWAVFDQAQGVDGNNRHEAVWQGIATSELGAQEAVQAWYEAYQRRQRTPGPVTGPQTRAAGVSRTKPRQR
jgi:hypothetical protein